MDRPSSTITWATLAGMMAAGVWELVATFTTYAPTAGLIALSTAIVSGIVGKLKKETIYKMVPRE